jgi:hypothetical protein
MTPQEGATLVEQLARKYVGDAVASDLHRACAGSPTCLRSGPTDVDESDYARLDSELPADLKADEDRYTELLDVFVDAYRAEWLARVKPCK